MLDFHHWPGQAARLMLDVLLPPMCLTCDRPVEVQGQLCASCFGHTHAINAPHCARCGVPLARRPEATNGDIACFPCQKAPPPWARARAALRYDDHSKRLILPLKYGYRTEVAEALAPMMARAGADLLHTADWLVPVPLHRTRLMARRYNQAALLARAVGKLSRRPTLLDALRRVRATAKLAELPSELRQQELTGAIAVNPRRAAPLRESRVVLIDDVLTSGATARACAEALLAAGVASVDVLAAARASSEQAA